MSTALVARCTSLIEDLELGTVDKIDKISPLTGGVSSDIALVELGGKKFCIKFALEKLKVAEEWYANVDRNQAEYRWFKFVSSVVPQSVPKLLGCSKSQNGFAMEFIEGDNVYLWKTALLQGEHDKGEALMVGDALGKIHHASVSGIGLAGFQNQQDFFEIRIEPYLKFTASKHPDLAVTINSIADSVESNQHVIIHGDISPKNIMFKNGHPILLDAECATVGDPAFDLAFCLNHLVLKSIHIPDSQKSLTGAAQQLWDTYKNHVSWESADALEKRVCELLPALMLARVDGKSPVEYLTGNEQSFVRLAAISALNKPEYRLSSLLKRIF